MLCVVVEKVRTTWKYRGICDIYWNFENFKLNFYCKFRIAYHCTFHVIPTMGHIYCCGFLSTIFRGVSLIYLSSHYFVYISYYYTFFFIAAGYRNFSKFLPDRKLIHPWFPTLRYSEYLGDYIGFLL